MKTTVVFHSADFDGLFCREIARKFLPGAELIGWDFGDKPIEFKEGQQWYVLDLPVDRVFGWDFLPGVESSENDKRRLEKIVWIDHHKSSIASHPTDIPGYRIDGVAACRLAWQWFNFALVDIDPAIAQKPGAGSFIPSKDDFVNRAVSEPLAVRLAGEYDIWDKRDPDAELFQHGLRSQPLTNKDWDHLLTDEQTLERDVEFGTPRQSQCRVSRLLKQGEVLQYARTQENASIIHDYGFTIQFEGLTFLACNHARFNSFLFTAGIKPEHDALFGFKWTGKDWGVSLYHAPGKEHHDLSLIAVKHGGGGHRGACGFAAKSLPFLA